MTNDELKRMRVAARAMSDRLLEKMEPAIQEAATALSAIGPCTADMDFLSEIASLEGSKQ